MRSLSEPSDLSIVLRNMRRKISRLERRIDVDVETERGSRLVARDFVSSPANITTTTSTVAQLSWTADPTKFYEYRLKTGLWHIDGQTSNPTWDNAPTIQWSTGSSGSGAVLGRVPLADSTRGYFLASIEPNTLSGAVTVLLRARYLANGTAGSATFSSTGEDLGFWVIEHDIV